MVRIVKNDLLVKSSIHMSIDKNAYHILWDTKTDMHDREGINATFSDAVRRLKERHDAAKWGADQGIEGEG